MSPPFSIGPFYFGGVSDPALQCAVREREHLRRLDRICVHQPLFFVTTCTYERRKVLTMPVAAEILIDEFRHARDRHRWTVGRYVIMPDHVHFFCTAEHDAKPLHAFVGAWKSWTSRRLHTATGSSETLWQPEFFDHVIRSSESYAEKWNYVRDNPVRAGLVASADEWPYCGEITYIPG